MNVSRRTFLAQATSATLVASASYVWAAPVAREFDVHAFGATGDGRADDTAAVQKAIEAAAAAGGGSRVLLRGGKRYLTATLMLRGGMEFHLADDAVLMANPDPLRYPDGDSPDGCGLLMADGAIGLTISGTGQMDGQAMKFMTTYSETDMRWEPKAFRPRMFSLRGCKDLTVKELTSGTRRPGGYICSDANRCSWTASRSAMRWMCQTAMAWIRTAAATWRSAVAILCARTMGSS